MNKYLIIGFSKVIINAILIFLSLGVVLNLFEEIEFLKNLNLNLALPVILSLSFVPTLILELLPFIIFLSSVVYLLQLRSSKNLLSIKVFGYSNLRIIFILSIYSFLLGLFTLLVVNPVTSKLIKYYETEKAKYSIDIDHLISINKNGVWIREVGDLGYKVINAEKLNDEYLEKISVFVFDNNHKLVSRLESKSALITDNPWKMKKIYFYDAKKDSVTFLEDYEFQTKHTLNKINSLYKNLNTISFVDLILNYSQLNEKGYSKKKLNEKINKFIVLPIFLFLMVFLAAIFTIGSLQQKQNFYYVLISILTCVAIYYFKDLSFALGQSAKISLVLSVWMPLILISLFCTIGVIHINEK